MERLEVVACFDWLEKEETVGTLSYEVLRGTEVFSFEYSRLWLKNHPDMTFGRDLAPYPGVQYAPSGQGIFGCFADALPDSWGRKLIDLRADLVRKGSGVSHRRLSDWDYLKGVEDSLRMGGFRFKDPDTGTFLNASDKYQIPPILNLGKLMEASQEVERSSLELSNPDERWIKSLWWNGSSAGGARPKVCISDNNDLYIAKFPSLLDGGINVGKWEYFANIMEKECGIHTAVSKLVPMATGHDIFLSKRFDRTSDMKRIHMASALTLLGLSLNSGSGTGHGYPDIAGFIVSQGTNVEQSLEELYRRVAFSICIGNSDDHFKNHSFLLTQKGWELSPVYDINPSIYPHHSLLIDGVSNESSLDNLFKAHKLYFLEEDKAHSIIQDVITHMKEWEVIASECGLKTNEMTVFKDRFEFGIRWEFDE